MEAPASLDSKWCSSSDMFCKALRNREIDWGMKNLKRERGTEVSEVIWFLYGGGKERCLSFLGFAVFVRVR